MADQTPTATRVIADFAEFHAGLEQAARDIEALKQYAEGLHPPASSLDTLLGRVQQSGATILPTDAGVLAGIGLAVLTLVKSYEPVFAALPAAAGPAESGAAPPAPAPAPDPPAG